MTMITGNGIDLYRLIALRASIKLEGKGVKFRGGSRLAYAKRYLGVKGDRAKVLAALSAEIERAKARIQPGDITP